MKANVYTIIINLCESATALLRSKFDFSGKENIILSHFWCLIEYVIPSSPSPESWLAVPTVLHKILEVIELGYFGATVI